MNQTLLNVLLLLLIIGVIILLIFYWIRKNPAHCCDCKILEKKSEKFAGMNGKMVHICYISILCDDKIIELRVLDHQSFNALQEQDKGRVKYRGSFMISFKKNITP
ncbi:hypothetical protein [Paenibacillus chitinolyticus]|uniref:hypothetical protein n=1 Tax=Paenibacillus chitinolyticus TaxID=79263 RepID=UPI00366B5C23